MTGDPEPEVATAVPRRTTAAATGRAAEWPALRASPSAVWGRDPSAGSRDWEHVGTFVADLAGEALIAAFREPPTRIHAGIDIGVEAEGIAPLSRARVLAKLDHV